MLTAKPFSLNYALSGLLALSVSCSAPEQAPVEDVGLSGENYDSTVRPQDDLFSFANGGWVKRSEIPADRGRWGAFDELREYSQSIVLDVLTKAAGNPAYTEGTDQRKAADFYSIGMDSLLAERAGLTPLKPALDKIDAINDRNDLQNYLVGQELEGGGAFFGLGIFPDLVNSRKVAAYLGSGGIGLPERDYYLKTDAKSKETQAEYVRHIGRMLALSGWSGSASSKAARRIMAIETRLAKATLTKEESRNPTNLYHPMALAEMQKEYPSVQWSAYFTGLGIEEDTIIVTEPAFIKEYDRIAATVPLDDIRAYLRWSALRGAAPFLNHDFVQESFDFNRRYLTGVPEMLPRWKRVLTVTDNFLGEAIGKLYVEAAFPPEAKVKAQEMVENIRLAYADRIRNLPWMSDSTKKMALTKLSTITVKIGYPDTWRDYSQLKVEKSPERASYYANAAEASRFAVKREVSKLGKPVDRKEWQMSPQTVNAYYNPLFNEIVFPAAILQPPFYNYKADEAVNYGGVGAVIGHEISHGFDDSGSQFDSEGNMKNWWSEEDRTSFQARGDALAAQFDLYEPLPGVKVQGKFTLGENIGDLGGVTAAYDGLQRYYREHGRPAPIGGLTPEQRFFLSWATIWRTKYRDETLRTQVYTDPHAPGMYRGNGPVSNLPQFYDAFGVKPGDKLYREEKDRVQIW